MAGQEIGRRRAIRGLTQVSEGVYGEQRGLREPRKAELPAGILSSCNNGCFGQTKNDEDRKAILAHLARNTKGFVNSEYDRFLARMPIGMFIVKLGYTEEITQTEPYLIEPTLLKSEEPSDEQIVAAFSPRKRYYRRSTARVAGS